MREPDNGSIVLFDLNADKIFWFRDDELAARADYDGGERWFEAGVYEDGPVSWRAVLNSAPDSAPILLVRAS